MNDTPSNEKQSRKRKLWESTAWKKAERDFKRPRYGIGPDEFEQVNAARNASNEHLEREIIEENRKIKAIIKSELRHRRGGRDPAFAPIDDIDERRLQDITNRLWHDNVAHFDKNPNTPPRLTLSKMFNDGYVNGINPAAAIMTIEGDYVIINEKMFRDKNTTIDWEQIIAHEIAHIFRGDTAVSNNIHLRRNPKNENMEILTDRLGAIVLGNPRLYACLKRKELDGIFESLTTSTDFSSLSWFEQNALESLISDRHQRPSRLRDFRMLERWADILEANGAADPQTGAIIDKAKALETYAQSKDFTMRFSALDNNIRWAKAVDEYRSDKQAGL